MKLLLTIFFGLLFLADSISSVSKNSFQLPLKKSQAPPFPLKLLASSDNAGQRNGIDGVFPLGPQGASCQISIEVISITGQDKAGKDWEVKLSENGLGYMFYGGDLDKNGYNDAVLVTYTNANGFLPNSILSII